VVHIFYIDESADEKLFVIAALALPVVFWKNTFDKVREFRLDLQRTEGIDIHAEFHAWKFVSGRGNIASPIITKGRRCQIFQDTLRMVAALPGARMITTVSPSSQEERGFQRLMSEIQQFVEAQGSHALLICDQGKEVAYTRYAHALRTTGAINNIVEEPLFRDSAQSYPVQLSDFCAYALLRQEHPLASKTKYGLDQAFQLLEPIVFAAEAHKKQHKKAGPTLATEDEIGPASLLWQL